MSEDQQVHEKVYLFVIANGNDGYAEFTKVYKRPDPAKHNAALSEIMTGGAPIRWIDVTGSCASGGLDMRFKSSCDRLIFVLILNQRPLTEESLLHLSRTYFGTKVVTDLTLTGKPSASITSNCLPHGPDARYPTLCSFELKMTSAQDEMQRRPDADPVTRFPIMFDFVDTSDGVSPVYKKPDNPLHEFIGNIAPQSSLGHGGIHPRGGSSMIELA